MRVAIYARFSSDLQDVRSITDRVAAARDHATRQGWQVVSEFSDAAISGASLHNRPGLLDLLAAAQGREFDAVLTESIDRLSRDLEDIAGLHKRLAYWGVKIVTLADGEVGKLHVGLKGIIASVYLDDLAQKTRRGQVGRVRAGRIPGGRSYGYDVATIGEDRGQRTINQAEAEIIRRIFREYVDGNSALEIAGRLNRERIAAPRSREWNASTINGSRKRLNGIINNRLYIGKIVYNRQRFIKDPQTGRRQARPNSPSEWLEQDVPELAIVPIELFEAAQQRRSRYSCTKLSHRRRPKHLLSGLAHCGCCGASMIIVREDRVGCSARINKSTCDNRRTIRLAEIEQRILKVLQEHLLTPDVVASAIEAFRLERERLARGQAKARRTAERELAAVMRKISGVIAAIEAGGDPRSLADRINELEAERRSIEGRLPSRGADEVFALHPRTAERYKERVAEIHRALSKGDEAAREAVELVRELIDRIVVTPTDEGEPMNLELVGNVAALLEERRPNAGAIVAVAGPRNHHYRAAAYRRTGGAQILPMRPRPTSRRLAAHPSYSRLSQLRRAA
ncbi:MAG: recombinase family protein [Hyphomicrobiaceae bacterium]|nr:MAG: recombinase family protein [Hyphomicrobiaceae bacterium]